MIPRRFDPAIPEMMDRRGHDPRLLRDDLLILEAFNRHLGGHRLPLHYLNQWRRAGLFPTGHTITLLDLATGAADVPRAVARWARHHHLAIAITAVDNNPDILEVARARSGNFPEIQFEQQDLLALPYPTGSHDFVLNSLSLHHFAEPAVVAILRRIQDIARVGYVVNDLRRARIALWFSNLLAHTVITNPIARFDAPVSCERAFTIAEIRALANQAGLTGHCLRRHWAWRFAVAATKP